MAGSLPPSSTPQGINRSPARAAIARPVLVEPVNCTMSTESTTAAPVAPRPVTHANTGGAPICSQPRANSRADSGVTSEGLTTTAAPASSAATASIPGMSNGKFHGVITPTTGYGRYTLVSFLVEVSRPCGRELLLGEEFPGPVGVVVDRIASDHHFECGLHSGLTRLGDQYVDETGFVVQQPVPQLSQPDCPGVGPQRLPGRLMGTQFVHDRGDRLGGLHGNASDELTGRGVAHVECLDTRG